MNQGKPRSLEQKLQSYGGSAVRMLRASMAGSHNFPIPAQYSSWPEEQRAWKETAALLDMGHHMHSAYFKGKDVIRLLSDFGVNSFEGFRKNSAKQYIACNEDGFVIGDAVLTALEDDEVELIGTPVNANWLEYQAKKGGYDVEVTVDPMTPFNTRGRRFFRYQIQGPRSLEIMESAADGQLPAIKFFHIGETSIAGCLVRVLSHTMSRTAGFEIWGAAAEGRKVLAALQEAGRPFGLRQVGAIALPTSAYESGWIGLQVPAIYTGEDLKPYREWLPEFGFEGNASLGGSFAADEIEKYYVTPGEIGYGRLVRFDHDFMGRAALERMAAKPPRRQKVWLRWDDEDVTGVLASSLFGKASRAKMLGVPYSVYSTFQNDSVLVGDRTVGVSVMCGYTVNIGGWASLAMIDSAHAVDGARVTVVWGDADPSARLLATEKHAPTSINATVNTKGFI